MSTGKVILAGAGPGDPELITLRAARYLQQAEVILADRPVSREILRIHASPDAEIIYVGKEGHSTASVSQKSINGLLAAYALRGKLVVRLKGGDVAFFSNVLDELQTLRDAGVDYEIVPGITAASGASAYSGIPLTARGFSDGVRLLTGVNKAHQAPAYWAELAATGDTLVFYMTGEQLPELAAQLLVHGIAPDRKLAVITQATTPHQQVHTYTFSEITASGTTFPDFISPVLIVIGKVVALHEQFAWRTQAAEQVPYFSPAQPLPGN